MSYLLELRGKNYAKANARVFFEGMYNWSCITLLWFMLCLDKIFWNLSESWLLEVHWCSLLPTCLHSSKICTAMIFLSLLTFSASFPLFSEILSKLSHRDVSNLTPTGIAIEVFVSIYRMFFPIIWLRCWLNGITILLGIGTNWRVSKGGRWHGHCRIIVFNKALNMVIEFHFICRRACQNVPSFSMWAMHHVLC